MLTGVINQLRSIYIWNQWRRPSHPELPPKFNSNNRHVTLLTQHSSFKGAFKTTNPQYPLVTEFCIQHGKLNLKTFGLRSISPECGDNYWLVTALVFESFNSENHLISECSLTRKLTLARKLRRHWLLLRGAVIKTTAARTKQLKDQMTGPTMMFHIHDFLDGLSLAFRGAAWKGSFALCFFLEMLEYTREQVWFSCFDGWFSCQAMEMCCSVGVAVMWCWLHYNVAVSQTPGNPGGQGAGALSICNNNKPDGWVTQHMIQEISSSLLLFPPERRQWKRWGESTDTGTSEQQYGA